MAGGAVGALLRYLVVEAVPKTTFPWPILLVNGLGCFFIGIFWYASEIIHFSSDIKIFLFIGLFGSFTTFSTYALETVGLLRGGFSFLALLNFALNNLIGVFMVSAGFFVMKGSVFVARMINNMFTSG